MRSLDTVTLLLFGFVAAAVVAGWYLGRHFSAAAITRRGLRKTKVSAIAKVGDDQEAKVVGVVRCEDAPLRAPLTGRKCACWQVSVEERGQRMRRRILREQGSQPFVVEDDTGKAMVEAETRDNLARDDAGHAVEGAMIPQLALTDEVRGEYGSDPDLDESLTELLSSRGKAGPGGRHLLYREAVLEVGGRAEVFGLARWAPDPDPTAADRGGYRGGAKRLVLAACADGRLLISAEPDLEP